MECQQQAFSGSSRQEQHVAAEEENYRGDSQYEKERFTDRYNENFEDDEFYRLVNIYTYIQYLCTRYHNKIEMQ